MKFTTLTAIAVALTTANALAMNRRAPTTCEEDLNAMDSQLDVVTKVSQAWTPADGYLGALQAQLEANKLHGAIESATESCAYSRPVSSEKADKFMRQVHDMIPRIESILDHFAAKKSDYDTVLLTTPLVKSNLQTTHAKTNALRNVVLNSTPESHRDQLEAYFNRINAAYDRVYGVYGR
ncbi:hypothetical protein LRAMOSA02790 [Lichtheimia ramosa]|uniref:Uncharacterized protein n=1 Tax=Lichtheimia ramosa TaxID=688394 RepID=A0A077WSR4_9FUNG|nr:hypothetical protein LRAMOSA02790 [Lichtheimia ramosa]